MRSRRWNPRWRRRGQRMPFSSLERVFAELRRVLRPEGRVVFVEPWLTPFLRVGHRGAQNPLARRLSVKLDALATMIENERQTYEKWLGRPRENSQMSRHDFSTRPKTLS